MPALEQHNNRKKILTTQTTLHLATPTSQIPLDASTAHWSPEKKRKMPLQWQHGCCCTQKLQLAATATTSWRSNRGLKSQPAEKA